MHLDPKKDPFRVVLAFYVLTHDSNEKKKYQMAQLMLMNEFGVDYSASKLKAISTDLFLTRRSVDSSCWKTFPSPE